MGELRLAGDQPDAPAGEAAPQHLAHRAVERQQRLPLADPAVDIGSLVSPVADAVEAVAPQVVKCACQFAPGAEVAPALYFSRQPVPWGDGPLWHHIGVYAFRRAALARFVALPPSPLEGREKLEQLRALEAGMRIAVAKVEHGPFGVDTPADLERARAMLAGTR